ncbi:MAG: hypothetical protein ACSLE1_12175 [Sphingobium sp.]
MTVAVTFPDGTIRQVISALKLERDRFVQTPINCDPHWKYVMRSGQWFASSRHGNVRIVPFTDRGCWWDDISQMHDQPDEVGPRRSAA